MVSVPGSSSENVGLRPFCNAAQSGSDERRGWWPSQRDCDIELDRSRHHAARAPQP
jgi:hypothetical protein